MPTSLSFDEHLDALETSGRKLLESAAAAGMDASVPPCPAWDVHALLAHQTMVHRWAAANIRGEDPGEMPNQTTIRETVSDIEAYYAEGLDLIVGALREAPDDLETMTFLKDAPPPRRFWARRQAHETTIHMVDAIAARLGRVPGADETGISRELAEDGLDELLRGFFTRGRSKLYDGVDLSVLVAPTDSGRRWLLHVSESMTVEAGDPTDVAAAVTLGGTAVGLYLGLWNRGESVESFGDAEVLATWRAKQRVGWS